MQLRIDRQTLVIIPESDQDIAFLEDSLKMRHDGDILKFERIDDGSKNWVKFKLESFMQAYQEDYCGTPRTPSRKTKEYSSQFRDIGDENEVSEHITLVDIEEIE